MIICAEVSSDDCREKGRADVGQVKAGTGKRAVGIRGRVMSHLATVGEIRDPGGMASTTLARAIGYPGSSVAFAQLLSAMERSGMIERDIRGRRTYRIAAARTAVPAPRTADDREEDTFATPARDGRDFDYDELARRLLAQVLARGTTPFAAGRHQAYPAAAEPEPIWPAHDDRDGALEAAVVGLERTLADVRTRQRRLTEENARLLEQIRQAQQSLAAIRERASRARPGDLAAPEIGLLIERLLSSLREGGGPHQEAGAG